MSTQQIKNAPAKTLRPDFGSGRYSKVTEELYDNSIKYLDLTPKQAERLAKSFAADIGRVNLEDVITFGKVRKGKDATTIGIKTVAKAKGIPFFYSLKFAKLLVTMQECEDYGAIEVKAVISDDMAKWLNKSDE